MSDFGDGVVRRVLGASNSSSGGVTEGRSAGQVRHLICVLSSKESVDSQKKQGKTQNKIHWRESSGSNSTTVSSQDVEDGMAQRSTYILAGLSPCSSIAVSATSIAWSPLCKCTLSLPHPSSLPTCSSLCSTLRGRDEGTFRERTQPHHRDYEVGGLAQNHRCPFKTTSVSPCAGLVVATKPPHRVLRITAWWLRPLVTKNWIFMGDDTGNVSVFGTMLGLNGFYMFMRLESSLVFLNVPDNLEILSPCQPDDLDAPVH